MSKPGSEASNAEAVIRTCNQEDSIIGPIWLNLDTSAENETAESEDPTAGLEQIH